MWPSGSLRSLVPVSTTNPSNAWNAQSTAAIRRARRQREDALGRARSITKAIAVASVAGVAAIGLYVSRVLPGHTSTSTGATAGTTGATAGASAGTSAGTSPGSSSGVSSTGGGNSSASQSGTSLAPPNNPPAQTQQPAPVVSGST